jgi:hypothetical protein
MKRSDIGIEDEAIAPTTREEPDDEVETEDEPADVADDVVAEELAEAFIESATAGKDVHERRSPEGPANLEPEETAVAAVVDEVLLAFDEPLDPD